jgi:tetratricopeptide (TPR) repeat protein
MKLNYYLNINNFLTKRNEALFRVSVMLVICMFLYSCKKSYLDAKPNKAIVVLSKLQDYQALIDNASIFNASSPSYGEISADGYYVPYSVYQSRNELSRDMYIWKKELIVTLANEWQNCYRQVYYSNTILEGLSDVSEDAAKDKAAINSSALFFRANAFYNLSQVFCPAYDNSAGSDPGIVLKLNTDLREKYSRATVQQTYDRIISDLKEAEIDLPIVPLYKTRPSKPAVQALLARTYLSMRDYTSALKCANEALGSFRVLLNYNTLDTNAARPFTALNPEVLFHNSMVASSSSTMHPTVSLIDPVLFNSYDNNDLRKKLFFKLNTDGTVFYKGSYVGDNSNFTGLATDELYLIRAECYARAGKIEEALIDLNTLLVTRWKKDKYVPYLSNNPTVVLDNILMERRKELFFRGLIKKVLILFLPALWIIRLIP